MEVRTDRHLFSSGIESPRFLKCAFLPQTISATHGYTAARKVRYYLNLKRQSADGIIIILRTEQQ